MRFFGKLRLQNEEADLNFRDYEEEVTDEQKDAIEYSFILNNFFAKQSNS